MPRPDSAVTRHIEILLPVVRAYEQQHGELPTMTELQRLSGISKYRINDAMKSNDELARMRLSVRLAELNMNAPNPWFTLGMAAEFLKARGVPYHTHSLGQMCHDGKFPGAVMRWRMWLVPQTDLEQLAAEYETVQRQIAEQQSRRAHATFLLRRSRCIRCEIRDDHLVDGLCRQCVEETSGTFRWYPIEPAPVSSGNGYCHYRGA